MVHVVYHTKTGHSRKIAAAVADALTVLAKDIRDCDPASLEGLLFIVSGVYADKTAPELLNFVKRLAGRPVTAVLISSCTAGLTERKDLVNALRLSGIRMLPETFVCPGSFLFFRLGRPNLADRQKAADFAVRTARLHGIA